MACIPQILYICSPQEIKPATCDLRPETETCPLCSRELAEPCSLHHLLPLSQGGRNTETVMLHQICHDKIHATFTERELAQEYHSIEKLLEHEAIQSFVKWVSKQPPQLHDRTRRAKRKDRR